MALGHGGVVVVVLGLAFAPGPAVAGELAPVAAATAAPALALPDLEGRPHRVQDYAGSLLIVDSWATWCPPCVAEMPGLQRLAEDFDHLGLRVLAVSNAEPAPRVRHFRDRLGLGFAFLLDAQGRATADWGVELLPTSYVVDALGRLRLRALGEVQWDHPLVRARLRALLESAPPASD